MQRRLRLRRFLRLLYRRFFLRVTGDRHLAGTAIAATPATLADVVIARVLGAENADGVRGLAADRAGECGYFHQYFFFEREGASLLMIPRQRWASSSAILKFCSLLAAKSSR